MNPLALLTDTERETLVKALAFMGRTGRLPFPGELASLLGIVPSAARARVQRLAQLGLIQRQGRRPPVLTPEGARAAELLWDLGLVPEEDRGDYVRALRIIGARKEENRAGTAAG